MQAAPDGNRLGEAIWILNQLRASLIMDLGLGPSAQAVALYEIALASRAVDPVSQTDGIRVWLIWGLLHLHSGEFDKPRAEAEETWKLASGARNRRGERADGSACPDAGPLERRVSDRVHGLGSKVSGQGQHGLQRTSLPCRILPVRCQGSGEPQTGRSRTYGHDRVFKILEAAKVAPAQSPLIN